MAIAVSSPRCSATWSGRRTSPIGHDPEIVHELTRDYQEACTAAIDHHGGSVFQFQGDGVVAYFCYPRSHEDDPLRAVLAGLEILERMGEVRAGRMRRWGWEPTVRIGVHTGLVAVQEWFSTGLLRRGSVAGATPNLASRLQTMAEPGTLVISDTTAELVTTAGRDGVHRAPPSCKGHQPTGRDLPGAGTARVRPRRHPRRAPDAARRPCGPSWRCLLRSWDDFARRRGEPSVDEPASQGFVISGAIRASASHDWPACCATTPSATVPRCSRCHAPAATATRSTRCAAGGAARRHPLNRPDRGVPATAAGSTR